MERPLVDRKPLSQFVELRSQTLRDEHLVQPRPQLRHVTKLREPASERSHLRSEHAVHGLTGAGSLEIVVAWSPTQRSLSSSAWPTPSCAPRPSTCDRHGGCGVSQTDLVYTIHATKKLLDRVKQPVELPVEEPSTALGNWYATVLFW